MESTVRLGLAGLREVARPLAVVALQAVSLEGAPSGLVSLVAAYLADHLFVILVSYLVCFGRVGSCLVAVGLLLVRVCRLPNLCHVRVCLLYTSPSPRDLSTSRMPSSA